MPQAGLNLSNDALTKNYKALFYDKPNAGSPGITKPMDSGGCVAGAFKLIDSANPMNSLMYTKAFPMSAALMPPCGARMPVIEAPTGPFTDADRMCLLNWINSVIAASR